MLDTHIPNTFGRSSLINYWIKIKGLKAPSFETFITVHVVGDTAMSNQSNAY